MRSRIISRLALQCGALGLAITTWLTLAGCGHSYVARYPVHGTVKVNGRTAAGAKVVFCPINPDPAVKPLRPSGTTDADGDFQLTTVANKDGAPAGEYKVLVTWPPSKPTGAAAAKGRVPKPSSDQLNGKYDNVNSTPLRATVATKTNDLPPFELTTQ